MKTESDEAECRPVLRLSRFWSRSALLAAGLLFPPDFLCLACQRGNYGASLRPRCEGVGRSLSNCPPELQTSSCISRICSHPKKRRINCSNGLESQIQGVTLVSIRILLQFFHLTSVNSLRFRLLFTVFYKPEIWKGPNDVKSESLPLFKVLQHPHTLFGFFYKQGTCALKAIEPTLSWTWWTWLLCWFRLRWEKMWGGDQNLDCRCQDPAQSFTPAQAKQTRFNF